jgi:hypothetical protein
MRLSSGRKRGEMRERRGEDDFVNLMLASYHGNNCLYCLELQAFIQKRENVLSPKVVYGYQET